jgi:FMN phosphatase YigB (HAD superfamily)
MSSPIFIKEEKVIFFDVDDTLVMWKNDYSHPFNDPGVFEFNDPYDWGRSIFLKPHGKHIKLLKDKHARGYVIVVWSAGGAPWAQEVITKLGLSKYVTLIITKPSKFVDDLTASEVLGTRIYLKDDSSTEKTFKYTNEDGGSDGSS